MKLPEPAVLIRAVRPYQWLSNLAIFAGLLFSYNFFRFPLLLRVAVGFVLLCGLASAGFLVNDVVDRDRDRRHPVRRHRPIAAAELDPRTALVIAGVLAAGSLVGAYALQPAFGFVATVYLFLSVGYTLGLRRLPVLDVLSIAVGLVLRTVAGAVLIQGRISPWLFLGVGGVGLSLALSRVQYEMRLAEQTGILEPAKYTPQLIARMKSFTLSVTVIVYCLYTFLSPRLPANHAMMLTIPIVLYGAFRYQYLGYRATPEQSPEQLMLTDLPLLLAVAIWLLTVLAVLYLGRS